MSARDRGARPGCRGLRWPGAPFYGSLAGMLPLKRQGPVVKLGRGDLGGKARGLPFLSRAIRAAGLAEALAPHRVSVPETWVLATDCFEEFVTRNGLRAVLEATEMPDEEVRRRFLAARLPPPVRASLQLYLDLHALPLAVRSSAITEDVRHQPTAGLYATYFLPNRGPQRLRQLMDAVKLVYASTYFATAGRYLRHQSMPREHEQMGVALETVAGRERDGVYYPLVSGVAQSLNFFPVGPMKPEDGVVTIAMGLGRRVVKGLDGLRFCPAHPLVRPTLQADADPLRSTQRSFDAISLRSSGHRLAGPETEFVVTLPIEEASRHGTLQLLSSVWDPVSGIFYDSPMRKGPRVLTFNRLLRGTLLPLPDMMRRALAVVAEAFDQPVEIEFALELEREGGGDLGHLVLLQARPLPTVRREEPVAIEEVPDERILLRTDQVLGHGAADGVRRLVFVDPARFSPATSAAIAREVGQLNRVLRERGQPYILIGPGRWGSSNPAVGVPVRFGQIDGARVICEVLTDAFPRLEPSQGTHFFHNVVSRQLFYLTVDTRLGQPLALGWLRAQPNAADTTHARLIESPVDIAVRVDATRRLGLVYLTP